MKIRNFNADPEIANKAIAQKPYILDIWDEYINREMSFEFEHMLHDLEFRENSMWRHCASGFVNDQTILHGIEVRLVKDAGNNEYKESIGITDTFGAYLKRVKGKIEVPYIDIFIEKIWNYSKGDTADFKRLFTVTLFYEFMHAFMDVSNYRKGAVEKIKYSTEYGKWREESAACAAMLHVLACYHDKEYYNCAKHFMLSQSAEYALGVHFQDHYYYFHQPNHLRGRRDEKVNGVPKVLQNAWLQYVSETAFDNYDEAILQYFEHLIDNPDEAYMFEDEFFNERDLVFAVISKFIDDTHPSYETLTKVFPPKDHKPWSDKATYTKEYNHQFYFADPLELSDCTVYLYDRWGDPRNTDLEDFLSDAKKAGYNIKKLQ